MLKISEKYIKGQQSKKWEDIISQKVDEKINMLFSFAPVFILFVFVSSDSGLKIIDRAYENFQSVNSYIALMRSLHKGSELLVKYFYRKPGFVRMEFIKPHKGFALTYDPFEKRAKLIFPKFLGSISISLDPDNPLIRSPAGHTIDKSHIGWFLIEVKKLFADGRVENLSEGERTIYLSVKGTGEVNKIHGYKIWFDKTTLFPVKILSLDENGKIIEEVELINVEINVELGDKLFH